jgi:putative transcriptional regulator
MKKDKRNIFGELIEGIDSMKKHRERKITLKNHKVESVKLPKVDGKMIRSVRESLHVSQGVFASLLQVNSRTLANWEQDRSKPNDQAAALILLVREFPDTINRLKKIAA